jgi:SAM-dependent methyltransferase
MATGYARYWAPVLAPAVADLVESAAPLLPDGARVLDVGTGTGQLATRLLKRLPSATVVGIDPSEGMLEVAGAEAERELPARDTARFERVTAFADKLPFPDHAFDAALSSFVFQLVPNRARALRETRRVLRPGGVLAYVSWLDDERRFRPDEILDEVLDEAGFGPEEDEGRPGDVPSVERAANELRRAGFADVEAHAGRIGHRFSVDAYIDFVTEFDEETLFDELEPVVRERAVRELRTRLSRLSAEAMTMRYPIVFVTGRRSGR